MSVIYWAAMALLVYVVAGYGLVLIVMARFAPARAVIAPKQPMVVDFLIPAHNEAACIRDKILNTLSLENLAAHQVRITVIDDGSTDGTADFARATAGDRVNVVETAGRLGKLAAMNGVVPDLTGDVVVFSDANAMLTPQTLTALMRHFGDADVGGVCGQISVDAAKAGQIGKAESLFWRYDQALKAAESRLGGTVSAQGSIYAMRRALVPSVPPGTADDFYISAAAVAAGQRLVFEPNATTQEAVTEKAGQEMGRRVRSTEMGWRALMAYRHLMDPRATGVYAWQLISHKFLRRMTPFALIALFLANLPLIGAGWFYTLTGLGQILGYGLVALAWGRPSVRRLPLVGTAMFFVMGNLAMLLGLVRYWQGQKSSIWTPVREGE